MKGTRLLVGACLAALLLLPCAACGTASAEKAQASASSSASAGVSDSPSESASGSSAAQATGSAQDFDRAELIQMAIENQKSSYAPYSGYNVSAAVLAESGEVYLGANVENASYPAGVCAEHNAIDIAVLHGERKIVAIAIVGGKDYEVSDYCAPCGICRQVMREFADPEQMRVIIAVSPTDYKEMTLEELLPESFGPSNLG